MVRSEAVNVYIKEVSPRARWIFKLIFEELLGCQLLLSNDVSAVLSGQYPSLNYSDQELPGIPTIVPHGLLQEDDIKEQSIKTQRYKDLPVFFSVEGGDFPFDPFAVAFYLVSRYEEHLPFKADTHGRFSYKMSLAHKQGFLHLALVNRLASLIMERISIKYPEAKFPDPKYRFIPTFDIDIAFAHLGKGFVRTYGAMAKLMLKGDIREIRSRIKTMQGKARDPYDNFDLILEVCAEHQLQPLFFILAGKPGPHDRNLSTRNIKFAELLKDLSNHSDIGVHPSYGAGNNPTILKKEIDRVESATGNTIDKSRQHYVRLRFPETYDMLIQNGIKEDFSMGYADSPGFRASIASPYYYFNLNENVETDLRVYPFMMMDTTMGDYLELEPEQYLAAVLPVIEEVKACKGTLSGIWHNYAMADDVRLHKAFREIMKIAASG